MKNHSSSRATKGQTGFRTPHTFITGRPEALKQKYSNLQSQIKMNTKKFRTHLNLTDK